jgi:hypothetical protein
MEFGMNAELLEKRNVSERLAILLLFYQEPGARFGFLSHNVDVELP